MKTKKRDIPRTRSQDEILWMSECWKDTKKQLEDSHWVLIFWMQKCLHDGESKQVRCVYTHTLKQKKLYLLKSRSWKNDKEKKLLKIRIL
jgi:hypothetical protein